MMLKTLKDMLLDAVKHCGLDDFTFDIVQDNISYDRRVRIMMDYSFTPSEKLDSNEVVEQMYKPFRKMKDSDFAKDIKAPLEKEIDFLKKENLELSSQIKEMKPYYDKYILDYELAHGKTYK